MVRFHEPPKKPWVCQRPFAGPPAKQNPPTNRIQGTNIVINKVGAPPKPGTRIVFWPLEAARKRRVGNRVFLLVVRVICLAWTCLDHQGDFFFVPKYTWWFRTPAITMLIWVNMPLFTGFHTSQVAVALGFRVATNSRVNFRYQSWVGQIAKIGKQFYAPKFR